MLRSWRLICVALVTAALFASPTYAQEEASPPEQEQVSPLRQEFEDLFQQLLKDPSNRELNRRYIQLALTLDDPEAAIGALERLLFYNTDDPSINYQLGTLYLKVGAAVVAQPFFEAAIAAKDVSPIVRTGAEAGLAKAKQASEPSPIHFYLQLGARYQTNANVAPDQLDQTQGGTEVATPDWNEFGLLSLNYTKPIKGGAIEARLTTYYAEQQKVDRLDFGFGEVEVGPRIFLHSGENSSIALKPYGFVNGILLADDPYQRTLGGGVLMRVELSDLIALTPFFEYRDRDYFNSDDYPIASEQVGRQVTYGLDGDGQLTQSVGWRTQSGVNENDARVAHDSFDEYFLDMSLNIAFNSASNANSSNGNSSGNGGGSDSWTFTPFGGVSLTDYWAPDLNVDPSKREDFKWKAGASLDIPLAQAFGVGMQVQYTVNDSNLDRFDYKNFLVSSGPRIRF